MICLKCGNEIKDNEQICSNCGYNKNAMSNTDNPFGVKSQGIYNPNAVDKDKAQEKLDHEKQFNELVEIYIGPKYYNFKKGSFSWCALFLGPLYIAYRKMYGVSIIVYIINMVLIILFRNNWIIQSIVLLLFSLFLGFSFKKIYYEDSVEKVGKIKQQNEDKGFNQLTQIVKVKGGTNILSAILLLIIIAIIISLIMLIFNIQFTSPDYIKAIEKLANNI